MIKSVMKWLNLHSMKVKYLVKSIIFFFYIAFKGIAHFENNFDMF